MRNTQKVIAVVAYTLVAVAVGRYTVPQTVKIEKETTKQVDVVEKKDLNKQTDANRDTHTEVTVVEKVLPDGTKETTTKTVKDSKTEKSSKVEDQGVVSKNTQESTKDNKTTSASGGKVSISALAGVNIFTPSDGMQYGASVSKEVIGPISIGIWGLSSGTGGASIGIGL